MFTVKSLVAKSKFIPRSFRALKLSETRLLETHYACTLENNSVASFAKPQREKSRLQCPVAANHANTVECGQDKDDRKVITTASNTCAIHIGSNCTGLFYQSLKEIFSLAIFIRILFNKKHWRSKNLMRIRRLNAKNNTVVLIYLQLFLFQINKNENSMFASQV